jgi:hypothetical protein
MRYSAPRAERSSRARLAAGSGLWSVINGTTNIHCGPDEVADGASDRGSVD